MEFNESEILIRFLEGEDEAYSQIYQHYIQELFAYGKGLGFNREVIKDAIQDIFCKILCERKLLANVHNLKYYLFSSLKNRLFNLSRTSVIHEVLDNYESTFALKITILDDLIENEDRIALEQRLNSLLETLTDRQREAICLRFIHELEYDEIANLLNMTVPSARNLIARAIDHMRKESVFQLLLFLKIGINI